MSNRKTTGYHSSYASGELKTGISNLREPAMQLFVKSPRGRSIVVNTTSIDSVRSLKEKIADQEGISSDHRLIYAGKQLEDGRILSEYTIQRDSTIDVLLRTRGGSDSSDDDDEDDEKTIVSSEIIPNPARGKNEPRRDYEERFPDMAVKLTENEATVDTKRKTPTRTPRENTRKRRALPTPPLHKLTKAQHKHGKSELRRASRKGNSDVAAEEETQKRTTTRGHFSAEKHFKTPAKVEDATILVAQFEELINTLEAEKGSYENLNSELENKVQELEKLYRNKEEENKCLQKSIDELKRENAWVRREKKIMKEVDEENKSIQDLRQETASLRLLRETLMEKLEIAPLNPLADTQSLSMDDELAANDDHSKIIVQEVDKLQKNLEIALLKRLTDTLSLSVDNKLAGTDDYLKTIVKEVEKKIADILKRFDFNMEEKKKLINDIEILKANGSKEEIEKRLKEKEGDAISNQKAINKLENQRKLIPALKRLISNVQGQLKIPRSERSLDQLSEKYVADVVSITIHGSLDDEANSERINKRIQESMKEEIDITMIDTNAPLVIVSCPEKTRNYNKTGQPLNFMAATKEYSMITELMVIMGFDWAWSGNEYLEDSIFWSKIEEIQKDKENPFFVEENGKKTKTPVPARLKLVLATIARLLWYSNYRGRVQSSLMNAASKHPGETVYAVCIKGGPITKCEEYLMEGIVDSIEYAEYGAEKKPDIKVAKMEWGTFKKLIEQRRQDPLVNFKIAFGKPIEVFLDHNKHLDMSQGHCNTPEKVAALGKLLAANYKIEDWSGYLLLYKNNISNVSPLADGIAKNKSLTYLYLRENNISDVSPLADVIAKNNKSLTWLSLYDNKISDVSPLYEAIESNSTLKRLTLTANNIPQDQKEEFRNRWKVNHSRRGFRLYI